MIPGHKRYMLASKLHSYLGDHRDAIKVLNKGIEEFSEVPHLYRHRGHFKISVRDFEAALTDLERATDLLPKVDDEIEYYQAELVPEMERIILAAGVELIDEATPITDEVLAELTDVYKGTLKSNTWYHYGLAHYLLGHFERAADCYRNTLPFCVDDDMRAATYDWLYMSLKRAGRSQQAQRVLDEVDTESMHVNEESYLKRLTLYKGHVEPDELLSELPEEGHAPATIGYGVGNWHLYNNNQERAVEIFGDILTSENDKAFGYIAAEVDFDRI